MATNNAINVATAATGTVLQGAGVGSAPLFSTATYPLTTTSQQILYSTAANTVGQLTTANSALAATNASGVLGMRALSVTRQVFTSTGTYTPTTGMLYCDIEVVGSGGGGGGATGGATGVSAGAGGGAGGYAKKTVSAATIGASQSVTIGAGGTAGSAGNNPGGTGGTCSVGAIVSCTGGSGGGGMGTSAITAVSFATGGAGGIGSSGDLNADGAQGQNAVAFLYASVIGFITSGSGGAGLYGAGGQSVALAQSATNAGVNGLVYGGGASGGGVFQNATGAAGGVGAKGIVIITEYVIN